MAYKKEFMEKAVNLSRENIYKGKGGPFGALIVNGDEIISSGINCVTSENDPTAHAEIQAIRSACKKLKTFHLKGCVIYTSCEPCPMCLSAIYWAGLEKIYYANTRNDASSIDFSDDFIYKEICLNISERTIPMEQHLHDEALEVFSEWEKMPNKIKY